MRRKPDKQKQALKEALRDLVERLRHIEKTDAYKGMIQLYWAHGFTYDGPDWAWELNRAERVLQKK